MIAGIEKFSLVDYPEEICCVLFLAGCNFCCGFCHNPQLVKQKGLKTLEEKEILEFLKKRKGKLSAVCITGGEPLLTLDKDFVRRIKNLGYKVKIDTNGANPKKLQELIDENLIDYIAMDLKGPKELYDKITQTKVEIERIEESIKIISEFPRSEFRTTVLEKFHTLDSLGKMVDWVRSVIDEDPKVIYLQAFRNSGELLDLEFQEEKDTREDYLKELKSVGDFIQIR